MPVRVTHQYPLRAGAWLAQVQLPPDITAEEAFELCDFVWSLVGKKVPEAVTPARAEGRFFAETRPTRAAAVKLWEVRFEVVTYHTRGHKPKTHTRRLLVSAAYESAAVEVARPIAEKPPNGGRVLSVKWLSTQLAHLPVDLSEIETAATMRAGGRGYQAGLWAGFRAGVWAARQEAAGKL